MVPNRSTGRGTRNGMATAHLTTCKSPYSRALGCATRVLGVLLIIRLGLHRG